MRKAIDCQRKPTRPAIRLMIIGWILSALMGNSKCFAQFDGSLTTFTGDESKTGYFRLVPFKGRLDPTRVSDLRVKWSEVTRSELGNRVTLSGTLMLTSDGDSEGGLTPIDWEQGISVIMECEAPNHNSGPILSRKSNRSLIEATITDDQGRFQVTMDIWSQDHSAPDALSCRAAIAIAKHISRNRIEWSSRDEILVETQSKLNIPATLPIDPELLAIHKVYMSRFNPALLIRAVNCLQRLGKQQAIETLEKYVAMTEEERAKSRSQKSDPIVKLRFIPDLRYEWEQIYWISKLLFEPIESDGNIPIPTEINQAKGKSANDWPLNPIYLQNDIPFLIEGSSGFFLRSNEGPQRLFHFIRQKCILRDQPLRPSGDLVLGAQHLVDSQIIQGLPGADRHFVSRNIRMQALRSLGHVESFDFNIEARWQEETNRSLQNRLHWEDDRGFVR